MHLPGYWDRWNAREDVKELKRAHADIRRSEDPEAWKAYHRATYERRKPKHAAEGRAWRERNPERCREISREMRARRKARKAGGKVTPTDYAVILAEHGMVCHICGGEIESRADLHFDHVIPLARGGPHHPDNIKPAHARCNIEKGARVPA